MDEITERLAALEQQITEQRDELDRVMAFISAGAAALALAGGVAPTAPSTSDRSPSALP
jgi:hypothetical protein